MTEKRFECVFKEHETNNCWSMIKDNQLDKPFYIKDVVALLNEQQNIIHRDEMSIKIMMSNMEKLEEANDNMNLFIKQTIEPLLFNCVFELNTIESMSQVELANKIEDEIIPFIQDFKYLKYESPEEEKQDKSE